MKFNILTYFLGSLYIVNTLFHKSYEITDYLFKEKKIDLPLAKFDKINEVIYSSGHCIFVSIFSFLCFDQPNINYNQFLDLNLENKIEDNDLMALLLCFSLSYFLIDLFRCLYHQKYLFIIHHCCASFLLAQHLYLMNNNKNQGLYAIHSLFLLESNNILLNIGYLLKEFNFHYSITCSSWIIHLVFFSLFRLIQFPKVFLVYLKNDFEFFNSLIQLPNLAVIYMGSSYWAYRQFKGIKKYLKENCVI